MFLYPSIPLLLYFYLFVMKLDLFGVMLYFLGIVGRVVQYYQMQKGQHLKRIRLPLSSRHCIICQFQNTISPAVLNFPAKILSNKYKYPPLHDHESGLVDSLLRPRPSTPSNIAYQEACQLSKQPEILQQYSSFQTTVQVIKPLILTRTEKDRYTPIHFTGTSFKLTVCHFLRQKLIRIGKSKFKKVLSKNGSGTSTDEEFYSSPIKAQNRTKQSAKLANPPPQQTPEIRRLTRNLSSMIQKFEDNFEFHPSLIFELMDAVPGHVLDMTEMEKQRQFKRELGNLSIISKEKPMQRLHTIDVPFENVGNSYGLQTRGNVVQSRCIKTTRDGFKKISTNKSRTKLKENVSPNQRIYTDYDCQIIKKQNNRERSSQRKGLSKGVSPSLKPLSRNKVTLKTSSSRAKLSKKY